MKVTRWHPVGISTPDCPSVRSSSSSPSFLCRNASSLSLQARRAPSSRFRWQNLFWSPENNWNGATYFPGTRRSPCSKCGLSHSKTLSIPSLWNTPDIDWFRTHRTAEAPGPTCRSARTCGRTREGGSPGRSRRRGSRSSCSCETPRQISSVPRHLRRRFLTERFLKTTPLCALAVRVRLLVKIFFHDWFCLPRAQNLEATTRQHLELPLEARGLRDFRRGLSKFPRRHWCRNQNRRLHLAVLACGNISNWWDKSGFSCNIHKYPWSPRASFPRLIWGQFVAPCSNTPRSGKNLNSSFSHGAHHHMSLLYKLLYKLNWHRILDVTRLIFRKSRSSAPTIGNCAFWACIFCN